MQKTGTEAEVAQFLLREWTEGLRLTTIPQALERSGIPAGQRLRWGAASVVLAVLLIIVAAGCSAQATTASPGVNTLDTSPSSVNNPVAGSSFPDFSLTLYQGDGVLGSGELRFASLLGKKPIVLNYWASACAPCTAEMPEFERVWRKYNDKVVFLGLDIGRFVGFGGPETSKQELRRLGITYPAAPVADGETLAKLKLIALPSTDFITPEGKVYRRWNGSLDEGALTVVVEGLLRASAR